MMDFQLTLTSRKPLPLTTVELQKTGSRLLHLSPKTILDVRPALLHPSNRTDALDDRSRTLYTNEESSAIRVPRRISSTRSSTLTR